MWDPSTAISVSKQSTLPIISLIVLKPNSAIIIRRSFATMNRWMRDGGGRTTLSIYDCPKPIIAAINGPAVGVGVTMTLPMDIRLASEDAKFGFVFARRGLVPEAASSWFLPRLVGISKALEWTYSGKVFSAEEAKEGVSLAICNKFEII